MKTSEAKTGLSDGVGEFLRRERELRHISLDDVAGRTKISRRYLEAIEESRYDRLPGETFVRGFIRSYAKSVGLDPDETMLVYNQACMAREPPPPRVDRIPIEPQPGSTRPLLWLLVTGLVIVGGAFFGIVGHLDAPSLPRLRWPSQAEVAKTSGAAAPLILTAAADSDTWLRVTIDEQEQQDILLHAGQSIKWTGKERIDVSIGNVGATRLRLNGRELAIPVASQSVLRHYIITRDMLQ